MDVKSAQIATICGCIDHSFAFALWCDDFARYVDPDDMVIRPTALSTIQNGVIAAA